MHPSKDLASEHLPSAGSEAMCERSTSCSGRRHGFSRSCIGTSGIFKTLKHCSNWRSMESPSGKSASTARWPQILPVSKALDAPKQLTFHIHTWSMYRRMNGAGSTFLVMFISVVLWCAGVCTNGLSQVHRSDSSMQWTIFLLRTLITSADNAWMGSSYDQWSGHHDDQCKVVEGLCTFPCSLGHTAASDIIPVQQ